jgi:hypothetical protein
MRPIDTVSAPPGLSGSVVIATPPAVVDGIGAAACAAACGASNCCRLSVASALRMIRA